MCWIWAGFAALVGWTEFVLCGLWLFLALYRAYCSMMESDVSQVPMASRLFDELELLVVELQSKCSRGIICSLATGDGLSFCLFHFVLRLACLVIFFPPLSLSSLYYYPLSFASSSSYLQYDMSAPATIIARKLSRLDLEHRISHPI